MSPKLVEKETEDVVVVLNNANNRLKFSGYNFPERHKVIEAGITNYRKRKLASKEKGQRMFLTEEEARSERDKKKLGVKETWYRLQIVTKKRERNQKGFWKKKKRRKTHEVKVNDNQLQSQSNPQEEVKVKTKVIPYEVISVLFIPCTPHSELAKMLRRDEQAISKLSRYCIKIVERTGTILGDLLRNKGPNYGQECGRDARHTWTPRRKGTPAGID